MKELVNTKEIDFLFCWRVFKNSWRYMIPAAVLGGLLAFAVSRYVVKPTYRASVVFYFGRFAENGAPQQKGVEIYRELSMGQELVNDYCELINTNRIQNRVKAVLRSDAVYDGQVPKNFKNYSIKVESIKQTRLMRLQIDSLSAYTCQAVANTYAEVFNDEVKEILHLQNSQVVDRAELPLHPFKPNVRSNTALGVLLGILLVYAIAFLHSLFDTTLKTQDEAAEKLGLPVIGSVPLDVRFAGLERRRGAIVALEESTHSKYSTAEHFRSLRVNLQYDDTAAQIGAKVIVMTSAIAGEGKSFTAANLSVALAESGQKVLLINCDLRKPTLRAIFDNDGTLGLVNILVGKNSFEEVVVRGVLNVPLDVVFCGPVPPNPSKLLMSDRFRELINSLKPQYDYIILDAPPVLAAADASIIGKYATGILLLVRANYTSFKATRQAIAQLAQSKLNIIGLVFNRYEILHRRYGYGYGYGYGYDYNYGCDGDDGIESKAEKQHSHKHRHASLFGRFFHNLSGCVLRRPHSR